ncbi:hypothetical protein D915_009727 [Fasciola hepatica]|uniref:Uncharacterized protein n=1 Tax=Fasciola hepatica TaxID=6192 RepID=A0A4E0QX65_FASHE|nr:hypothetical protein D915_009727 [Fasciola hepatica]
MLRPVNNIQRRANIENILVLSHNSVPYSPCYFLQCVYLSFLGTLVCATSHRCRRRFGSFKHTIWNWAIHDGRRSRFYYRPGGYARAAVARYERETINFTLDMVRHSKNHVATIESAVFTSAIRSSALGDGLRGGRSESDQLVSTLNQRNLSVTQFWSSEIQNPIEIKKPISLMIHARPLGGRSLPGRPR